MFGLGKGKIELQLDKYQFKPGEEIKGTLIMTLKKPVEAGGVDIRLFAQQRQTRYTSKGTSTRYMTLYDFSLPLDREKTYPPQPSSYKFSLKIPTQFAAQKMPDGTMGQVIKVAQFLAGGRTVTKWYVIGKLKVKGWGPFNDISKKVQINVV